MGQVIGGVHGSHVEPRKLIRGALLVTQVAHCAASKATTFTCMAAYRSCELLSPGRPGPAFKSAVTVSHAEVRQTRDNGRLASRARGTLATSIQRASGKMADAAH
jgi:hypothetical protein